jgi:hypothetical protein
MSTARPRSHIDHEMRASALRSFALSLPEAEERETWGEATYRVRNKIFMVMGSDGKRASVKATHEEQEAVLTENPAAFHYPSYVGVHGWIGVVVSRVRTDEMRELVTEAWRMTAPKRLVKSFDEEA